MDWVLPTDEIIAKVETIAEQERTASLSSTQINIGVAHPQREQGSIGSRLRKFALHLKRHS
jgi:hypothetical protein